MLIDTLHQPTYEALIRRITFGETRALIQNAINTARRHLGMDIAFVSEFLETTRVFRFVDSATPNPPVQAGTSLSLEKGYCRKVVEGKLPQLIPDTSLLPEALVIEETRSLPIGAHLSVPIRLGNGTLFGTLCCFSAASDPSLGPRDLDTLRTVAELIGNIIEGAAAAEQFRFARADEVRTAISAGQPHILFQPICALSDMSVVGFEALARFNTEPVEGPDRWFQKASDSGLGPELELEAVRNALAQFGPHWRAGTHIALNVSPETILDQNLLDILPPERAGDIVLELTEHQRVEDYDGLTAALRPLRQRGVKIAVDDAGSGYASLQHVLKVEPDIIKMDLSLVRDIDSDRMRQALCAAIVEFARRAECTVVAEGIETAAELDILKTLGVAHGQGYFLGRPMDVELAAVMRHARLQRQGH